MSADGYGGAYRGRRSGAIKPELYFALGLVLLLAGAAIFFFAPAINFLALLSLCLAALCFVYFALRRALESGVLVGLASALIWIIRVLFVAGLLSLIVVEGFVLAGGYTDEDAGGADYLVVLGCGVDGSTPSLMLRSRIDAAADYLAANPNTTAVLSGGRGVGEDISEAEAMRRELASRGVEAERLILEENSSDTIENIRNSLELVPSGSKVAVLSNDFHLCRARLIAKNEGCEIAAVCAKTPRADLSVCYYIREYFSLLKVFFTYLF